MVSLKDIVKNKREQQERNDRPDIKWFSFKGKKSPLLIRFLQELDEDSPSYNSSVGKALFLEEHNSAYNFMRRAECTMESEGRCFACEMHAEEPVLVIDGKEVKAPWRKKTNMYIQVVDEDGVTKVLSKNAYGSFVEKIMDFANDEGEGSITGTVFKVTKGTSNNSPWDFATTKQTLNVEDPTEVLDLEQAIGIKIPYAEQKKFYGVEDKKEPKVPSKVADEDDSW